MADVGGWIWERNLRSFLELLSHYVGYGFDATDWETVALAVEATDDERQTPVRHPGLPRRCRAGQRRGRRPHRPRLRGMARRRPRGVGPLP